MAIDPIVAKNIQFMTGTQELGMQTVLSDESWGGNADAFVKGTPKPLQAANFYFRHDNGEIVGSSNKIKYHAKIMQGQFIVELQFGKAPKTIWERIRYKFSRSYPKIVRSKIPPEASEKAKITLALSVKLYNQL